jgi:hypothetical protein
MSTTRQIKGNFFALVNGPKIRKSKELKKVLSEALKIVLVQTLFQRTFNRFLINIYPSQL